MLLSNEQYMEIRMAALPYMQFCVAEYLADTTHLDGEQHGAYLLLMFHYWQIGEPLPNDDDYLAAVARVPIDHWPLVMKRLARYFDITESHWIHHRIDIDLETVKIQVEKSSKGGKNSAAARKRKAIASRKKPESNQDSTPLDDSLQPDSNQSSTPLDSSLQPNGNQEEEEEEEENQPHTLPAIDDPIVIEFPTTKAKDGTTIFLVRQSFVDEMAALYPNVVVIDQLRAMKGWILTNMNKRKTQRGTPRFINNWLSREQNKGGQPPNTTQRGDSTRSRSLDDDLNDTSWAHGASPKNGLN